jgi:hypothetical protein
VSPSIAQNEAILNPRPFDFDITLALDFFTNNYSETFFAERLSSAMNALGAERAARSTIRDKRVHSL